MSDAMPCPCCGSDYIFGEGACRVCAFRLGDPHATNVGTGRCARCGSQMPEQFDFCPVCGLDQRRRFRRPATDRFGVVAQPVAAPAAAAVPQLGTPFAANAAPAGPGPAAQASPMGGFTPIGARAPAPAPAQAVPAPQPMIPPSAPQPAAPLQQPFVPLPAPQPGAQPQPAAPPSMVSTAYGGFEPTEQRPAFESLPPARVVLVRRDGTDGDSFPFMGPALDIGRTVGDVTFAHDEFLSPRHARIERTAAGMTIIDVASRNGVYLRLRDREGVYPGDLFLIGHQLLRLENLEDGEHGRDADAQGTRAFGSPVERAWGKVQLIGGGGANGDVFYLRGSEVVFGRELGDIIFPHDSFLSRRHAQLRMVMTAQGMSVVFEDLGSANGSYLRIRGRSEIHAGDMFRIGDQILRVQVG